MTELDDLARQINALGKQLAQLRSTQLGNSSVTTAGDVTDLSDAVDTAVDTAYTIPGLQDSLDSNNDALAAAAIDVQAAIDAAQEASDAGVAAGELASAAADEALARAQEALDAAAQAGGGATYTGRAPTASDPGRAGAQWFVWDSNYHVTAYYVYQDDTFGWVQTVLDDGTFGNLSAARLTSGFIDAARIAAGSLTAAVLAADTLTSREIGADAILARNIKAAVITGDKIAARTIAAGNIVANSITGNEIAANTITAAQIQAGSITANEINLNTLNGQTITGATIRSAASGQRVEFVSNRINFYSTSGSLAGNVIGTDFAWGSSTYPVVSLGGGSYGLLAGGGMPLWSGTTVGLRVNGDTAVKRVFLDPSLGADGYVCGIYGFKKTSATDSTPIPMPLLYAKGNSGSAYPDMFIENIKSVTAGAYLLADGTSATPVTGTAVHTASIAAGAFGTSLSISFPAGKFSSPPVVVANASNSRVMTAPSNITTTGASIGLGNWSTGAAGGPITVTWIAYAD